jgi:hypothetical protein
MSMKSSARSASKAKAKRLTAVTNGKVDASGWTQPCESKTPRTRRAYAAGGKVTPYDKEVEKEAGCAAKRADKRPRKFDGGPTVGTGDPREFANNMMQGAANRAPVSGSNPIPTYTSASLKKSPLRMGIKKGGAVKAPKMDKNRARGTVPAGSDMASVPKRIQTTGTSGMMPDTDFGPMKKGGRACKAEGGATYGRATMNPGTKSARRSTDDEQKEIVDKDKKADACMADKDDPSDCFKKGGRAERKAGGRVKGKTNINIIIAPAGGGEAAAPPQMGAPGPMPPHPPAPPMPPAGGPPGAPGGAPGGMPANPLAGMPPQAIAALMGGAPGGGASMPPSGPPRLPMRAAGGRLVREMAGAGSGEGRLEKSHAAAKQGRNGL